MARHQQKWLKWQDTMGSPSCFGERSLPGGDFIAKSLLLLILTKPALLIDPTVGAGLECSEVPACLQQAATSLKYFLGLERRARQKTVLIKNIIAQLTSRKARLHRYKLTSSPIKN